MVMQPVYLVLSDTQQQGQGRRLLRNAQCVLLAMEAPRTSLDPPLAAVPFALWAHIKPLQVIMFAQSALLDTQPLQQDALLTHLVVSALLAILAL